MRGIAVSPASRLIQVASSFSLIQIPENIWKRVWKNFCSLELPLDPRSESEKFWKKFPNLFWNTSKLFPKSILEVNHLCLFLWT
jgi:hypothetical protein